MPHESSILSLETIKSHYNQAPFGVLIIARDRQKLKILYANAMLRPHLNDGDYLNKALADTWPSPQIDDLAKLLIRQAAPESAIIESKNIWLKLMIQDRLIDGHPVYILWAYDVSDIKGAETALRQAAADADALAETKSNFLATMSHEMRTPMQSVYGLLELIGLEKPAPNIMEMINIAKQSASGLLEILDDILDFAKIDANKMELDTFEVPVRTLVYGVLEALAVKVVGKSVTLKHQIEQSVPFVIVGDPKRLRQILLNLIGNALKFTADGSVTVRVSNETRYIHVPENRLALRFEIIDTGIGMPPEVAGKLFQAFTQADNSTARKFGGTGLGLSICKKLVELMGGAIGVDSVVGTGSTFWFEIPTEEVSVTAQTLEMPDLAGVSVLSVEDHPQGAKEIVNSLRSMGASIESVPTVHEALDLIKKRPFDVGVIDQGLPDGLGLDLIRQIVDIRPFMGLIMYTVRDDAGLQHSLQSLGVRYLAKPASRLGLGDAVAEATRKIEKTIITGPRRLLIAEDTASIQDLLRRQLKALGVDADIVNNGQEALDALASGGYGILFTDLHMPEIDGYDLVKTIRDRESLTDEKRLPVIVVTADVQMAQRQIYMSHGFDECLLKPVSLGHFRRLLIRWGLLEEQHNADTAPTSLPSAQQPVHTDSSLPPAIDTQAMIEQMGAFDESAIEMLGMFIDMTRSVVDKLQQAQSAGDIKNIKEAAHSLKGGARSACAMHLGNLAAEAQEKAESNIDTNDVVQKILAEFERVADAIQQLKPLS